MLNVDFARNFINFKMTLKNNMLKTFMNKY